MPLPNIDRRSIRRKDSRRHKMLFACPRGHWHPRARRGRQCDVGMVLVERQRKG